MPCFQVRSIGVDLTAADPALLRSAVSVLGLESQLDAGMFWIADGQIRSRRLQASQLTLLAGQIKRAYAAEAVKVAAKRFGWTVQQPAANKLTVGRRF